MDKVKQMIFYYVTGIFVMLMLAVFYIPGADNAKATRDLTVGQVGWDVRQTQEALGKKGYDLKPADGIFGLRTYQAVADFQKENGIRATGVVDRETRDAIYEKKSGGRRSVRVASRTVDTGEIAEGMADTRNVSESVSRGISRKEVIILARAIHGEARGESLQGQAAVGAVIVNRTRSGSFPDTIDGVIFQPGAFDAVDDGQIWLDPDQKSVKAAELALSGYDPTGGAIYYWNPVTSTSRWIWSRAIITQIGDHVFAK